MNYSDFLQRKVMTVKQSGFEVDEIHPMLFDWQSEVVRHALRIGKYALFQECGMGKTLEQCEWSRQVQQRTNGKVLIIAPLAVASQTIREGAKIDVPIRYIRHQSEADKPGVYITNYDMLKEFVGSQWAGAVLDESSILKSYTGATKRLILETFQRTPYKLFCTATPAPNDHLELGNHAEGLNVMPSNEMIQRWFINDSMQAGNYRLKKHGADDFWKWVTSWAVCMSKPSDLGYSDQTDRYDFNMPRLIVNSEIVAVDHSRAWESGQLIVDGTLSATSMWREKRATMKDRCEAARDIVGQSNEAWIIWCETNDEADYLIDLFPEAVEVRGNHSIKIKEERLNAFTDGQSQIIITKPDIAGYGLNWQHCHNQIHVSPTYSFEKMYQAFRRSWRFGQVNDVNVYLVSAESEGDIVKALKIKQDAHHEMQQAMNQAMKQHGLGKQARRERELYEPKQSMKLPDWLYSQVTA